MSGLTCQKQLGAATAKDPSLVASLVCRLSGLRQSLRGIAEHTKSAGSRRPALPGLVQIALKPASKGLGLHRVFIRGKGCMYVVADSAFKGMQVDARAC
jgi:hypothetical protein